MSIAGKTCPLCGSVGKNLAEIKGALHRTCCGSLLTWSWNSVDDYYNQYMSDDYHESACKELGIPSQYERFEEHRKADNCRIELLKSHFDWNKTTLIDVGASNGAFVYAATFDKPCKLAIGLEPNGKMCDWARQKDIKMIEGPWESLSGNYDLIVATDLIEHLVQPIEFLKRCAQHASYVYLETPDWHSKRPTTWKHIKPKEHICLFSKESLEALARHAGLKTVFSYNPIEGKLATLLKV